MIEAVNSVLAYSSVLRGPAGQVSSGVQNASAAPQSVAAPPVAPYISPYISVDNEVNKAVLQIRDSDTGDVLNQFPSESRLKQIREREAAQRAERQSSNEELQVESDNGDSERVSSSRSVTPSVTVSSPVEGVDLAASQQASAALSSGYQAGVQSASASVSVTA